jgi:hypothetical protein
MAEILEFTLAFVAIAIYGTAEKPRHPIWRNSIRTVAFALAAIAHAAFARVRSTKSSAAQRFSPNRPLDQAETGGLQTDLSLRFA